MKNLLCIIALFLCINSYSQVDTTVFITAEVEQITTTKIDTMSNFFTIDTVNFDYSKDSVFSDYSDWVTTRIKQVNPNLKRVRKIRFRVNDQGVTQKQFKVSIIRTRSVLKRRIRK